jgi:hypothetical protein
MAHGQQIENAERLHEPEVFAVGGKLILERLQTGCKIPMRHDDAFGFSRSSRGEDDLGDIVFIESD